MSDTSYQTPGSRQSGSLSDKASSLARDVKDQASSLADKAGTQVKDQVSNLTEGAKDMAASAGEKLRHVAEEQKNAGAEYVSGVAGAVRNAAGGFDDQLPQAANYIRQAAEQIDSLSDALQRRDLNELFDNLQSFARRQPTAFLGATFLAGFAAVRFLKSSMPARPGPQHEGQYRDTQAGAASYGSPRPYGGSYGGNGDRRPEYPATTPSPSVVPDRTGM
jgi:gas vesicle protein